MKRTLAFVVVMVAFVPAPADEQTHGSRGNRGFRSSFMGVPQPDNSVTLTTMRRPTGRLSSPMASLLAMAAAASPVAAREVSTVPPPCERNGAGPDQPPDETSGRQPLAFEPTGAKADPETRFLCRGRGYELILTPTEAVIGLLGSEKPSTIRLKLVGARPGAGVTGLERLPGISNYFIGDDPTKWRTGVPHFSRVRYEDIYPGIDLVYYGTDERQLEYDFVVAAGADPRAIHFRVEGADRLRLDDDGDLVLSIPGQEMTLRRPRVYQLSEASRVPVTGRYILRGSHRVDFEVGEHDASRPLIIDPVLESSTYLGITSSVDFFERSAVAVDGSGSVYVTGQAGAFLTGPGTYLPNPTGTLNAIVAKFAPDARTLIYATFIGGQADNAGAGIAVDAGGYAYVAGHTDAIDFPTTPGAYDRTCGSDGFCNSQYDDAFVTKLSPNGSLVYSTYLGGGRAEQAADIAVDASGNSYVAGTTLSSDFPATPGAFDTSCGTDAQCNSREAFVTKLNAAGSALLYSTFLGGSFSEGAESLAVAADGSAFVGGTTFSPDFPTTPGAFDTTCGTDGMCNPDVVGFLRSDVFVARLNAAGSALHYSTYLGGSDDDGDIPGLRPTPIALALDGAGNAYVTGPTFSTDFPTTPGAFQASPPGEGFVTKLNPTGSALSYSTFFVSGSGIAVDNNGRVLVTGDGIVPGVSAFQPFLGGTRDAHVARFNPTPSGASSLLFSTQLGGSGSDRGDDIAVDATGNAFVVGRTGSTNFNSVNTFQETPGSAFLAKISFAVARADLSVVMVASPDPVEIGSDLTYTITVTNSGPRTAGSVDIIDTFSEGYSPLISFSSTQGSCEQSMVVIDRIVTCRVGSLPPGGQVTVTVIVLAGSPSGFGNRVVARSVVSDDVIANNEASIFTVPFSGPAGRVPDGDAIPGTPLTVKRESSGFVTLSWGNSCVPSDFDYEIYEGTIGNYYSHSAKLCTTDGATTITVSPAPGGTYYLAVPRNFAWEGSYGVRSSGAERPPGTSVCLPQQFFTACP